jgi:hypothetical protein
MKIQMEDGLPIVSVSLRYKGKMLVLDDVLWIQDVPIQSLIRMK